MLNSTYTGNSPGFHLYYQVARFRDPTFDYLTESPVPYPAKFRN
jgi:hypothetical protein